MPKKKQNKNTPEVVINIDRTGRNTKFIDRQDIAGDQVNYFGSSAKPTSPRRAQKGEASPTESPVHIVGQVIGVQVVRHQTDAETIPPRNSTGGILE